MLDRFIGLSTVVITCAVMSQAQSITFSSPVPWVTQRNDTIVVRTQIDTSVIKERSISLKLVQVVNGEKKSISSKKFKFEDISGDFSFGSINKQSVGGDEFIQLEWEIPGTNEKGIIEPIGIINEKVFSGLTAVTATKVGSVKDMGTIESQKYQKLGDIQFALGWNKDALFIATKKESSAKSVAKFSFDGKNGKSAYLSYPDRIVTYSSENDSIKCMHFSREIVDESLKYQEKLWNTSVTTEKLGDVIVIVVPWYDTGIIPFEERMVGFGMFAESTDGTLIESVPATAKPLIPGTWTNIVLAK